MYSRVINSITECPILDAMAEPIVYRTIRENNSVLSTVSDEIRSRLA